MDNLFLFTKNTLATMKWFGLTALFGCGSGNAAVERGCLTNGNFEICWEVHATRSGAWYNNGGDINAKVKTSWFFVKYQGKTLKVPQPDGKEADQFWQAKFLKNTPRPALIVGINSMYLISEENGAAKITTLDEQESDFATYQMLDGDHGQPGAIHRVMLMDDSESPRYVDEGRYLMVNGRIVLDLQTLEIFPFQINGYELLRKLDGYNAFQSYAAQLSPQKTQIVLVGSRSNPENTLLRDQHALVVVDFKKNTAYSVPFDDTDNRFYTVWDFCGQWIDTYFQWSKDPATGEDRIAPRTFDRLPPWQGRWNRDELTGDTVEYFLVPARASMVEALAGFIKKEVQVKSERDEQMHTHPHEALGRPAYLLAEKFLVLDSCELNLYYTEEYQQLTLKSSSEHKELVRSLGNRFDEALRAGKFAEHFGRFDR